MILQTLQDAHLAWGDAPLLDKVNLTIEEGQRFGLIGRNGTGKSSLLKVLAGVEKLDAGKRNVAKGLRAIYVEQDPVYPEAATVYDALFKRGKIDEIGDEVHRWEVISKLNEYIHLFGLNADASPESISGGEKKKGALALAFALEPQLLLLDEPTNHLDIDAIFRLEELILSNFRKNRTLVTITHDRSFLNKVAQQILELDRGDLRTYPGNFEAYEKRKNEELEAEEKARSQFDKFWAQEEVWIRKGIEARRTRNEGRVRRLEQIRREREARRDRIGTAKLALDAGGKSGKMVAELEDVCLSFGDRTLVKNLNLRLMRGDKLGLIGPNGVGKSSLIKVILGKLKPTSGKVRLGTNLEVAYFDQLRAELNPEKTLVETVSPGSDWVEVNGQRKHVIGYLGDFLFPPHRANVKVSSLSGGEKNRLLLAKLFAKPANLLVMDEPTNDLDIESLEMLEDTLSNYQGTIILVSHDQTFMDNVASFVIAPDSKGVWTSYVGGYEEWLRHREELEKPAEEKKPAPKSVQVREKGKPTKLSYKENKELEKLPSEIESLEEEQKQLIASMSGEGSEKKTPDFFANANKRMAEISDLLEKKYARWEELDQKKASFSKN